MERRFAVHAGAEPKALIRRKAPRAWSLAFVVAVISIAGVAEAKPKRRDAKVAFDRGIAAYKKGSFEAASEALGKSFELERDVETLFAWAQAERKLEHCDKAMDLYEKLLAFDLPAANRTAVESKLAECRTIMAAQPKVEPPPAAPPSAAKVEPKVEPPPAAPPPASVEPRAPAVTEPPPAARTWYKDPVAVSLLGAGLAASGVGTAVLISAKSLDNSAPGAATHDEATSRVDRAKSRGKIGLVTTAAGGALLVGGVVWIFLHRDTPEQQVVTGWLAPGGGGLAVTGAF